MKKLILLIPCLVLFVSAALADETGKPFLSLFTPGQTGGHYLNWAFIQDDPGVMYAGNGWGIQEYDGSTWRMIRLPNGSFVRSFAKDSTGRIFVGSSTELGYLDADITGKMRYVSLLPLIPEEDRGFNYVWTIQVTKGGIYFQARERLFLFHQVPVTPDHPEGWEIKVWKPDNPENYFNYSFHPGQDLYILQRGIGLMKMVQDSLVLVPGGKEFAYDRAYAFLTFESASGELLLCTTTRGLFLYDGKNFRPFQTAADSILYQGTPYDGKILPDGSLALGTLSRGFLILDRTGKLKLHLTKETGLLANTVLSVYTDRQQNIWLGMAGGVGILEYESGLMQYPFASGAVPFDLRRHKGTLYASATDGIYYLDRKDSQFRFVSGLESSGPSNLLTIGGHLYAANVAGIFLIKDRKGDLAFTYTTFTPAFNSLFRCLSDSSLIFAGAINGLGILKYDAANPGRLTLVTVVKGIHTYIRQVVEPTPGVFWLSTYNAGVIRLQFRNKDFNDPVVERFGAENGIPVGITSVFNVAGRLVFGTGSGFYLFDEKERKFMPDPFFEEVETGVNPGECVLVADADHNIWANAGKETRFYRRAADGSYKAEKSPASRFADEFLYTIYPENQSTVWFGTTKSAIRYTIGSATLRQDTFPALIRRVKLADDSVICFMNNVSDQPKRMNHRFSNRQNDLTFEFTTLSYIQPDANRFSINLEGYDSQWSAWSDDNNYNFTNLPPGSYTFRVKAKNIYGQESTEDSFRFTILPPWYTAWWAYLGYILLLTLVFYGLIHFRTRNLRARSLSLEKVVRQRTHQIREQKDHIEKLSRIGRDITSSLSIENIIRTAYENVNSLMDASVFTIGLHKQEEDSLEFPAAIEKGRLLEPFSVFLNDEKSLAAWCFNHREEVFINHYDAEYSRYVSQKSLAKDEIPESVIYLPLWNKEKVTGVISAQSFIRKAYTDYHLNILRNVATYSAIALENADAYTHLATLVDELKTAQNRLVTQSKLAALGELTAGISHEIQNPLNFVNNFSEVSRELLDEMKEELSKGNLTDADALVSDIRQNLEKIIYHGKRADSIVKGMLQHSRGSSGVKQLTDINNLCDEFFRLSYHGIRAKDKSFNAKMKSDFDPHVGKVNLVSQDIGRVVLNLISNAFYSVTERKKLNEPGYEPTVWVSTRLIPVSGSVERQNRIEIWVKDNGTGISHSRLDKIFQPFYTTKPTGEGTGLGLSLSYDIVTKGHGGDLTVETKEGEGSVFIVNLPV